MILYTTKKDNNFITIYFQATTLDMYTNFRYALYDTCFLSYFISFFFSSFFSSDNYKYVRADRVNTFEYKMS